MCKPLSPHVHFFAVLSIVQLMKSIIFIPTDNGLGDQLIGLVTANWISKKMNRSLLACLDYDWINVPISPGCTKVQRNGAP